MCNIFSHWGNANRNHHIILTNLTIIQEITSIAENMDKVKRPSFFFSLHTGWRVKGYSCFGKECGSFQVVKYKGKSNFTPTYTPKRYNITTAEVLLVKASHIAKLNLKQAENCIPPYACKKKQKYLVDYATPCYNLLFFPPNSLSQTEPTVSSKETSHCIQLTVWHLYIPCFSSKTEVVPLCSEP